MPSPEAAAGAVEGVLLVVDGEHSEDDRYVAVGVEGGDALGDAVADIVEVGCAAADDAAEDDDGVVEACLDELRGGEGEFDGAGDAVDVDVVF